MIRLLLLIVIGLTSIGCGERTTVVHYIEPRLESHLNGVVSDLKSQGVAIDTSDLFLATEDLPGDLSGHCHYTYKDDLFGHRRYQRTIRIDAPWFDRNVAKPTVIKAVLAHEIGHCYLGRSHDDRMAAGVVTSLGYTATVYASLMNSQIGWIDPVVVQQYWQSYLTNLATDRGDAFGGKYEILQKTGSIPSETISIANDFSIF